MDQFAWPMEMEIKLASGVRVRVRGWKLESTAQVLCLRESTAKAEENVEKGDTKVKLLGNNLLRDFLCCARMKVNLGECESKPGSSSDYNVIQPQVYNTPCCPTRPPPR